MVTVRPCRCEHVVVQLSVSWSQVVQKLIDWGADVNQLQLGTEVCASRACFKGLGSKSMTLLVLQGHRFDPGCATRLA